MAIAMTTTAFRYGGGGARVLCWPAVTSADAARRRPPRGLHAAAPPRISGLWWTRRLPRRCRSAATRSRRRARPPATAARRLAGLRHGEDRPAQREVLRRPAQTVRAAGRVRLGYQAGPPFDQPGGDQFRRRPGRGQPARGPASATGVSSMQRPPPLAAADRYTRTAVPGGPRARPGRPSGPAAPRCTRRRPARRRRRAARPSGAGSRDEARQPAAGRERSTWRIPSTRLAVSRSSVTAPLPRVRYQSAGVPAASSRVMPTASGQPATRTVPPSWATSRAGSPPRQPAGASSPRTSAAVLAVFASTQVAAATETVRHGPSTRAGRRAGRRRARRGRRRRTWPAAPARRRTQLAARGPRWSSTTRTRQPPAGRGPAVARSPPTQTSAPPPCVGGARRRGRRSAPCPPRRGRRARPPGSATVRVRASQAICASADGGGPRRSGGRPARRRPRSSRRVDEPARQRGGAARGDRASNRRGADGRRAPRAACTRASSVSSRTGL